MISERDSPPNETNSRLFIVGDGTCEIAGPPPPHPDLFAEAVVLGREVLWWHTWGERFATDGRRNLPRGRAEEVRPVVGMPNSYDYDPKTQILTIGAGAFAPIAPEVWGFKVSSLKVLDSWLGYRMQDRSGKKSSDLDYVRPTRWTQTYELLLVLSIIEHTIKATPKAADLLERILSGPLIPASDLPCPTSAERKPPKRRGTELGI